MIKYKIIYYITIFLLAFTGVLVMQLIKKSQIKIRVRKDRFKQLKNYMTDSVNEKEVDKLLVSAGIPLDTFKFQLIRYLLFALWCISIISLYLIKHTSPVFSLLTAFTIFYGTSPKLTIFNKDTPFKTLMLLIANRNKYSHNLDLFSIISQFKNLASTFDDNPPSSHFILEQLRKFSVSLRPIFNTVIKEWSIGNKKYACEFFYTSIGTQEAFEFSNLLLKLDELTPNEMKYQLQILQETIFISMESKRNIINEYKSFIIYTIAFATLILILYNFLIVGYSIENNMLNQYI